MLCGISRFHQGAKVLFADIWGGRFVLILANVAVCDDSLTYSLPTAREVMDSLIRVGCNAKYRVFSSVKTR